MFDSKNLQNLGTSNFIHGMLAARKASQSSFPTIAALDFFVSWRNNPQVVPGSHFFSASIDCSSRMSWTQHVAQSDSLNHIFVRLSDLAEEGLPVGQELEVLLPSLELNSSRHFSLVDENALFMTITLKE